MTKNKNSTKNNVSGTRQSMSVGSQTLCKDDECVGKITDDSENEKVDEKYKSKGKTAETGTSMGFSDQTGCNDEECIGKK